MDRGPPRRRELPANVPEEDRFGTGSGQSYRPNRSPPPRPDYRRRSPPSTRPPPYGDPYPRGPPPRPRSRSPPFRRRSRSPPPFRGARDGDFRPRPRSPPRRDFGRDMGYRGPPSRDMRDVRNVRDQPRFADRPPADRSPIPAKRSRDVSPASSRGRDIPPPKRERYNDHLALRDRRYEDADIKASRQQPDWQSPPRRGFSPARDRPAGGSGPDYRPGDRPPFRPVDRPDPRAVDNWRRRSPSPRRSDVPPTGDSGQDSGATSRRSSPPVHPSRLAAITDDRSHAPKDTSKPHGPTGSVRSPRPHSPPRKNETPAASYRDGLPRPELSERHDVTDRAPPTGPGGQRPSMDLSSGLARMPPTGPKPTGGAPPAAPRAAQSSAPVAPRGELPAGPRGRGGPFSTPPYRGRGGFPPSSGRDYDTPSNIPSGPRGGQAPTGPYRASQPGTNAAPTYPRAQRFPSNAAPPAAPAMAGPRKPSVPYLASLPPILDEGKKLPSLYDRSKLLKLEDETERMRKALDEKQARKRKGLREWDRLGREVQLAELRGNLAEESLIAMSGGDGGSAAF